MGRVASITVLAGDGYDGEEVLIASCGIGCGKQYATGTHSPSKYSN